MHKVVPLKSISERTEADTEQFDYNIRNWPTKITSGEFEENLYYNTTPSNSIQTYPCYNGNICYNTWTYNGSTRGYQYNYDGLNRYTGGYAFINNVLQVDYQYSESFNYDKMGNITSLTRFSAEDISDQLYLCYNGNQLKYVNDNGIQQSIYGLKDYQNKSNTQDEFAYDANGNMTKDLDRDIVTIRYNLLNLPDTVQFKNGNQIINKYDAGGRKLKTDYFTMIEGVNVPLVNEGTVCDWKYNWDMATQTGLAYVDNFEYRTEQVEGDPEYVNLDKVYNAEGYVTNLTNPNYCYFRKDHLGNNREVWQTPPSGGGGAGLTSQRTQYYPSGLPWAEGTGASVQNKKYNGKEWIEMHGLDEYDSQARMYYPAGGFTPTMDPLCEKYYSISPYAWCGNNPVNVIDPDGRDWFYYQSQGEKKKSWHWQKGDVAKYTNTKGKEVTSKRGFDYLVTYKVTGKNREGAVTGSLQLWGDRNPNKGAMVTVNGVFSGNSNYQGMSPIPGGNYMMKLGSRDADGPQKLKPDGSNPVPYDGMQAIPNNAKFEWQGQFFPMNPTVTNAYGNGRIRLNQTGADLNPIPMANQPAGYYLHGKKDPHNWTHGCVSDKSEAMFNYLWNSNINVNVPFSAEY